MASVIVNSGKSFKLFVTEVILLFCGKDTCQIVPSPVCVIFSIEKTFLSDWGSGIDGGVCNITYSLNITDEPLLLADVGGLKRLELAEFY